MVCPSLRFLRLLPAVPEGGFAEEKGDAPEPGEAYQGVENAA